MGLKRSDISPWLNIIKNDFPCLISDFRRREKKSAILWVITQSELVFICQHFGKDLSVPLLKKGPIYCLETPVTNYHYKLCHVTEERVWKNFPYTRHCSTYLHVIVSNVFLLPHRVPFHDNFRIWAAFPLVAFLKRIHDKITYVTNFIIMLFLYLSLSSPKFWKLPAERIRSSRRVILSGQCFSCFSLLFYVLLKYEPEMRSIWFPVAFTVPGK